VESGGASNKWGQVFKTDKLKHILASTNTHASSSTFSELFDLVSPLSMQH
jgi:hypothetical protein